MNKLQIHAFRSGYLTKIAEEEPFLDPIAPSALDRGKLAIEKLLTQIFKSKKNYKAQIDLAKKRIELQDYDVPISSGLHRYAVNLPDVTPKDLRKLGYFASKIAVPERGQKQWTTWRHIVDETHLHRHGKDLWYMHKDEYPSMQAVLKRLKLKHKSSPKKPEAVKSKLKQIIDESGLLLRAAAQGSRHATMEGIPGYISYVEGKAGKLPTIKETDKLMEDNKYLIGKAVADVI